MNSVVKNIGSDRLGSFCKTVIKITTHYAEAWEDRVENDIFHDECMSIIDMLKGYDYEILDGNQIVNILQNLTLNNKITCKVLLQRQFNLISDQMWSYKSNKSASLRRILSKSLYEYGDALDVYQILICQGVI